MNEIEIRIKIATGISVEAQLRGVVNNIKSWQRILKKNKFNILDIRETKELVIIKAEAAK